MKIDLGRTYNSEPMTEKVDKKEKHYPSLYISDVEDKELAALPYEGTMTVRFCKTSSQVNDREGKKSVSMTLDIKAILDVEADEEPEKSREAKLDEIAEEVLKGADKGRDY